MKSFFTKLGTLLLCGVAVAVVGCTDFSEDIQAGDEALKGQIEATAENLSKAISGLETQLKADLAALQTTHTTDITKLTAEIEALEKALEAAENAHATDKAAAEKALADLQTALTNAKNALEAEIAAVKTDLQKEIDAAEAAAAAGIKANADGVAANKALIDGLTTQLAALEATVDAIDVRLTETEADVKALQDDLAAFKGDYQVFYGQVVNTIQNHANALSTLEADLEAGDAAVKAYVDKMVEELTAKIETVEKTLTSVNNLLEDEVKARIEGDEELNKSIEKTQESLTALNNLLADEVKNRAAADKEIQDYIAGLEERLQNKMTVVDNSLADLNDKIDALKKELSEEFADQISVVQNAISSIIIQHNELAEKVNGLDAALKAQTEALQAMKDAYEAKMAELDETDTDLYMQYEKLQEVITTLNNHITDLQAEDEALAASIIGVQEALSQYMRIDAEQTAELKKEIEDEILEKFNMLVTLLSATEERLTAKVNHIFDRVIANEIKIADLQEQTAELEKAVAALQGAHATLTEQLQNKLTVLDDQIEALQEADGDNATAIKALQDAHAVLTEQLQNKLSVIDDTIEELTEAIEDNKKAIEKNGASIEANAELIAKNAADIIAANQVVAEFKAAYEVFASNVDYALTNLTTATEANRNDIEGLLENVAEIQETLSGVQEDLTAAIGRIDVLEDAVKALEDAHAALIEGLQNKFTATDKEITDLQDANDALAAELKKAVKELYDNDQKNLDDLSNRLASHTDKLAKMIYAVEERLGKAEGKIADLEEQTAALEKAITELQNAHALLESNLQQKLTDLDNALAAMDETHKDDVKALQDAHARLSAQLEEALGRINGQIEVLEEAVADNKKAIEANGAAIEDNKELIAENAADIIETNTVIAELQAAFEAYKKATDAQIKYLWANDTSIAENLAKHTDKIMGIINEAKKDLAKTQEDLKDAIGRIDALEDAVEALEELAATLASKEYTDSEIKRIEDKATAIQNMLLTFITAAEDRANDKIDHLRTLVAEADELIKDLRGDVDNLLARVQSIVYVPEYNDHRAPIEWARLTNTEDQMGNMPIIYKKTDLRYRVYAQAGESAVKAAEDLAKAWENPVEEFELYYEVEPVKKWWTRSTESTAELNIVNVRNEGEFVIVTVVPQNFDERFFNGESKRDETNETESDSDSKYDYSVSLVLSDGNNNRSTEYVNLSAAKPVDIEAIIVDGTEAKKNITYRYNDDSEPVNLLPYDLDNPEEVVVLNNHELRFIVGDAAETEHISRQALRDRGYVVTISDEMTLWGGKVMPKIEFPGGMTVNGFKFSLIKDAETGLINLHTTLPNKNMTKEQYLAMKAEDKHIVPVGFQYIVNGTEIWTESSVELCNRLVRINLEVDVPWTLETAISTIKDSKMYEGPVSATFEYDLTDPNVVNKSLEGYSLYSIIHAENIKTTYAPKCPISLSVNEKTVTATLNHGSTARYAFPKPEDNVECNSYVVTKTAQFEDIDFVVTVQMNLGVQPGVQELSKDVTFTTEAGANGWLFGYWNALEDAYQKFLDAGYIGYKDDPELGKTKFFQAFDAENAEKATSYRNMEDYLKVNGETGIPQNVNVPFTKNNNEAGEHKFQLWHEQLVLNEDGYVDGTEQTIVQKVYPYFQIPFTFTVNGKVDLPDYALELDPVRVINRGDEKIVEVYGEIAGGVYTVDVSDLAKYYYVVNKEGVKSLTRVNADDVVDVEFTLSGMNKDTGYNFNGVADDIDYTLSVDWTKKTENYILPMSEAVAHWGTYDHTEVGVNAVLKVNGFPIVAKPITLVTTDPLEVALKDVVVEVVHKSGTNAEPIEAKVYQNFVLTSAVEESENLFNTEAWTIAGLFKNSKADVTYGAHMSLKYNRVYYRNANKEAVAWDESKISLGKYEAATGAYKAGDLNGTVKILADDGDIQTPIYVEFEVSMKHRIHNATKKECETSGIVTVTFIPEGYEFPTEE